jgi:hypothetical protein
VDILKKRVSCKFNLYLHHKEYTYIQYMYITYTSFLTFVYFQVANKTVEKFNETVPFKGHDAQRYGKICATRMACVIREWHAGMLDGKV